MSSARASGEKLFGAHVKIAFFFALALLNGIKLPEAATSDPRHLDDHDEPPP
jgi:hypothetical protein